jgi:hypothetical protein
MCLKLLASVLMAFPSALAIIWGVKLMISWVNQISHMLRYEFSLGFYKLRLIHRPHLDGLLLLL